MPTILATIANMGKSYGQRLPEAICCCLQTCTVNVVLLVKCIYDSNLGVMRDNYGT